VENPSDASGEDDPASGSGVVGVPSRQNCPVTNAVRPPSSPASGSGSVWQYVAFWHCARNWQFAEVLVMVPFASCAQQNAKPAAHAFAGVGVPSGFVDVIQVHCSVGEFAHSS
jgi:hypothetical protein